MCVTTPADNVKAVKDFQTTMRGVGVYHVYGWKGLTPKLQGSVRAAGPIHKKGVVEDTNSPTANDYPRNNYGLHFYTSPYSGGNCYHIAHVRAHIDDIVAINGGQVACTRYTVLRIEKQTVARVTNTIIADIKLGYTSRYTKATMYNGCFTSAGLKMTPAAKARITAAIKKYGK